MAGFYPDVPGERFAYHLDGTKLYSLNTGTNTLTDITSGAAIMNDEDGDYVTVNDSVLMVLFPEPRDISGYFIEEDNPSWGPGNTSLQVSSDTTTGLDGTWTTIESTWSVYGTYNTNPQPEYRQNINTVSAGPIKAMKFNATRGFNCSVLHLYGDIPTTQNPDRLIFWEPVNNNEAGGAYFDWGDIEQGSTQTKQFRINNNSSSKTASGVTVMFGVETYSMALTFSTDGTTFNSSISIGDLAPGATSSVLYVRRTVPANEPMQLQAAWMKASASSWA